MAKSDIAVEPERWSIALSDFHQIPVLLEFVNGILSSVECFPLCEKDYPNNERIRPSALISCERKEQNRATENIQADDCLLIIQSCLNKNYKTLILWVNTTVR